LQTGVFANHENKRSGGVITFILSWPRQVPLILAAAPAPPQQKMRRNLLLAALLVVLRRRQKRSYHLNLMMMA
jgi:hypothetical protein